NEACNCEPPDVPNESKTANHAQCTDDDTHAGVLRHMDRDEAFSWTNISVLLHIPPSVNVVNNWCECKVVSWWWRRCRPFQSTSSTIVWVACYIAQFITLQEADDELDDEGSDTKCNQRRAKCCNKV